MADKDKMLDILAKTLDGCPLTDPCDKLFGPDGWCKDHCKSQEPDAECWLKYAEVMAEEAKNSNEELNNSNEKALDTISRQAAIEVADAIWSVTGDKNVAKVWDQLKDLPSVRPDHIADSGKKVSISYSHENDLISRRAAIDAMCDACSDWCDEGVCKKVSAIQKLPSVTPKRKTGKWNRISIDKYTQHAEAWYECDQCGETYIGEMNYCGNCGAYMEANHEN